MKKVVLALAFLISLFISCSKVDKVSTEFVGISFEYIIEDMQPGNPIALDTPEELLSQITQDQYKTIDDMFYAPFRSGFLSGDLIYTHNIIYLTEITTGERYRFEDYLRTDNMFLIKPGTYKVSGKLYGSSSYYNGVKFDTKCGLVVDDEIIVKDRDIRAIVRAKYDSVLLICENYFYIDRGNYNYQVCGSTKYGNYNYCFLDVLNNDLNYNDRYIIYGDEKFECTSTISLDDYIFEKGKYYIIPTIKTGSSSSARD